MAKTSKDISESTLTRMQELCSALVFKRAIQDNAVWSSWEEIKEDVDTYDEIKKIWIKVGGVMWNDAADDEWMESFYKQQKVLLEKIGKPNFTEFTRDSSQDGSPYRLPDSKRSGQPFMEWIEEYLKDEFKIGNKDNWNPCDIWLIQDEEKYKKYPLYKSHSKYGFIEPLKSFVPSIGISEITGVKNNKYVASSLKDKSLYFFELKERQIVSMERVEVFERVRDLRFNDKKLYLFLEDTPSIGIINLE